MKRTFNPQQEIKTNKELSEELRELDPFIYNLVKNAKFQSIEKLNNLLEKLVYVLKDIKRSFEQLSVNPEAYNKALVKLGKVLEGLTVYLDKSTDKQLTEHEHNV